MPTWKDNSPRLPKQCIAVLRALQLQEPSVDGLLSLSESQWNDLLTRPEIARLMIPLAQKCAPQMPAWVLDRVDRNIACTAERFERIKREYAEIAAALRDAGVDHLVAKGFSLCPEFLAHPRFRTQSDVDLFCRPESIARAVEALHSIGYETLRNADHLEGHHVPPLGRKSTWKWRGDLFDPEIPLGVELHFRFSDETLEKFAPVGLEDFWQRCKEHRVDQLTFPTLATVDQFGYSALHILRHLLDGMTPIYNVFEVAQFLHRRAEDGTFWGEWKTLHHDSVRSLEAIACMLARAWFSCALPRAVEDEIAKLSPAVHHWFERFAWSPLEAWFRPNKDVVWLHAALAYNTRDRLTVVRNTLLPPKIPRYIAGRFDPEATSGKTRNRSRWTANGAKNYFIHACRRLLAYGRALPPALSSGARFWWLTKELTAPFWCYFTAQFFFDFGMFIFFFLFNLFLLDAGYNEQFLGVITSISSVGSVIGTIAGSLAAQRFGVRNTLLFCYVCVPALAVGRVTFTGRTPEMAFAFAMGLVSTISAVCYTPALAQTTTTRNRAFAFSLVTATLIGIGTFAGYVGGHLPLWFAHIKPGARPVELKRDAIFVASAIMLISLWPTSCLKLDPVPAAERKLYPRNKFLLRYLPAVAVWGIVTGSFSPFFNVYFAQHVHMPVEQIGSVFSISNISQVIAILGAPWLLRRFGLIRGTSYMQVATAIGLAMLALVHSAVPAAAVYIVFSAAQWMSEPGMETLLMNKMAPAERSGASALNLLVSSGVGAATALAAGAAYALYGYPVVLTGIAIVALVAAFLFRILLSDAPQLQESAPAFRVPGPTTEQSPALGIE
jgi:MFS family permease